MWIIIAVILLAGCGNNGKMPVEKEMVNEDVARILNTIFYGLMAKDVDTVYYLTGDYEKTYLFKTDMEGKNNHAVCEPAFINLNIVDGMLYFIDLGTLNYWA